MARKNHVESAKDPGRKALDEARAAFRRDPSSRAEERLVQATARRARELAARGQAGAARELLDQARERHPSLAHLLEAAALECLTAGGDMDSLLGQLLVPERESAVLDLLRATLANPADLAGSQALPEDHPLRREARAVHDAFVAVTSGPVQPEQVALPQVSRRSPLAPWKLLIRALEAYHRQDDDLCRRNLAALPEGTAPHRLVGPLLKALEGRPAPAFQAPGAALGKLLQDLDRQPADANPKAVLRLAGEAMALARQHLGDRAFLLQQDLAVRLAGRGLAAARIREALGGAPRQDARLARLRALDLERSGDPVEAACAWQEYLKLATTDPLEEAAVARRQADLLASLSTREREELEREHNQPAPSSLHPLLLYRRAAALDPWPEHLEAWLRHARIYQGREVEAAAEAWRKAHPRAVAPLLHLAWETRRRGALKQARTWLERAEQVDALEPQVRRLRRLVETEFALRHLKQGKAHLLRADLASLEARTAEVGDDLPLIPLRWGLLCLEGSKTPAAEQARVLVERLESPQAARAVLQTLAMHAGRTFPLPAARKTERLLGAGGRAARLAWDLGLYLALPLDWVGSLLRELQDSPAADPEDLHALARVVVRTSERELALALTRPGLDHPAPWPARFLLLRASCVPDWHPGRREGCLAAAFELARGSGDQETVEEALRQLPLLGFLSSLRSAGTMATPEQVLEVERWMERDLPADFEAEDEPCVCPKCRAAREVPRDPEAGPLNPETIRTLGEMLGLPEEDEDSEPALKPPPRRGSRRKDNPGQGLLFEEVG